MKKRILKSSLYLIFSTAILSISSCVEKGDIDSIVSISLTQSSFSQLTNSSNGHEYVDLGLSVNWATCNLGASSPSAYGDYYAWGETSTKSSYTWENYRFRTSGDNFIDVKFSKYNTKSDRGAVDNRTVLEMSDDVARQKWGGSWRMPTEKEFQELIDNCTWTWTTMDGINGYEVTSKKSGYTSRSIFLPAAGRRDDTSLRDAGEDGYYWSCSLLSGDPRSARVLYFGSGLHFAYGSDRDYGQSVRPVFTSTQSGLTVSESDCQFDCNGGTRIIQIYTEISWTASASADWITVSPKNGTGEKSITITVTGNPSTTERSGYVTITPNGFSPVKISVSQDPATSGTSNGHEWIDLGLSVNWATCNVGASSPSAYGDYYAWGETSTKSSYTWENYRFRTSGDSYDNVMFSKYNKQSDRGTVDNRTVLEMSDDVARQKWGGSWRMPTEKEFQELIDNCTWTWTTMDGVNGYKVTGKKSGYTSRSIFLPAAGYRDDTSLSRAGEYGRFWSCSLYSGTPNGARGLSFDSGNLNTYSYNRYYGRSVRPVCP